MNFLQNDSLFVTLRIKREFQTFHIALVRFGQDGKPAPVEGEFLDLVPGPVEQMVTTFLMFLRHTQPANTHTNPHWHIAFLLTLKPNKKSMVS